MALFTQIEESRYLPTRNNVSIKYLVDEFGGLTELNQRNRHWVEIQNTFVASEISNISLFDNKKFSNQKFTDGDKLIFDSGYFYSPILYFASCSVDPELSFLNLNSSNAYLGKAINSLSTGSYISGSSILGYPLVASGSVKVVSKLFDQVTQGSTYLTPGTTALPPTYSVQETGNHKIQVSVPFTIEYPGVTSVSSSWALQVFKNGTLLYEDPYTFTYSNSAILSFANYYDGIFVFGLSSPIANDIQISFARVQQLNSSCNADGPSDTLRETTILPAGDTSVESVASYNPILCDYVLYPNRTKRQFQNTIRVYDTNVGWVYKSNGETFTVGTATITVSIDTSCQAYC